MQLLSKPEPTIPSHWYFDTDHYQRELEAIWYRDWVCVGREDALPQQGDYFTAEIGNQGLIVTRGENGIRAFHNTCRHRGARICTAESGHFKNGRIICPYHTWAYTLEGELAATPYRLGDAEYNYSLYEVHVESWRGFIFVNLSDSPATSLVDQLGPEADMVANWPLETMRSVHQVVKRIDCNWKIYWENYSECYHCPRVHPELCKVMPFYKRGTSTESDLEDWSAEQNGDAETWAPGGKSTLPRIEGLSDAEYGTVVTFASFTAGMYIAAHQDYLRSVRLVPRGPEQVDLVIDWMLPEENAEISADDLQRIVDFPMMVIAEDGGVCELNQLGIRSARHSHGVLVEQEYELLDFHNWLRERLGEQAA